MSFWRAHFLAVELLGAIVAAALFGIWAETFGGTDDIDRLVTGNRAAIYGTLASAFGALLGFAITAASIALAFSDDPRLNVLKDSGQYPTFWEVFVSAMRALGIATVAAFVALVFDRDTGPNRLVMYAVVLTTILAAARVARCVWVLEFVTKLAARPKSG